MKKIVLLVMFIMLNASNIQELKTKCENGDGKACNTIGMLYDNGDGIKKNFLKAKEYYKKGCELNLGGACFNLGMLYDGTKKNYSRAKYYYKKACYLGIRIGCGNYLYLNKQGY